MSGFPPRNSRNACPRVSASGHQPESRETRHTSELPRALGPPSRRPWCSRATSGIRRNGFGEVAKSRGHGWFRAGSSEQQTGACRETFRPGASARRCPGGCTHVCRPTAPVVATGDSTTLSFGVIGVSEAKEIAMPSPRRSSPVLASGPDAALPRPMRARQLPGDMRHHPRYADSRSGACVCQWRHPALLVTLPQADHRLRAEAERPAPRAWARSTSGTLSPARTHHRWAREFGRRQALKTMRAGSAIGRCVSDARP
ncbi:hypothetical protein FHS42_006246 [Streptomyces zagrosensis]|uniref:Uncharacterized protein n=1 Tax=Streptomyces zagrosensis TaxID=1042984 RepID=A0A7W9QFQ0_9ACTN|nr:hypothetical protein [Streptomyces zagrosensis]